MAKTKEHTPAQKLRRAGQHRCGFCLDGKCDDGKCVSAIYWDQSHQLYICPCECNVGHTRCTRCGQRDVEVTTDTSVCVDVEGCDGELAKKRANNPSYMAILAAREAAMGSRKASEARPVPRPGSASRSSSGACLCCGEPTRGGLFLPGHDARYVSLQADAFLAADPDEKSALLDKLETQLSPKLMAKWVARVERQAVKTDKIPQGV